MGYAVRRSFRYISVVVILGIVVVPFLWVFLASFRPNSDLIQSDPSFGFDNLTLANCQDLQQEAQ